MMLKQVKMAKVFAIFMFFIVCFDYGHSFAFIQKGSVPLNSSCGVLDTPQAKNPNDPQEWIFAWRTNGKKTSTSIYMKEDKGSYFDIVNADGTPTGKTCEHTKSPVYSEKEFIIKFTIKNGNEVEAVYCVTAPVERTTEMNKVLKSFCNDSGTSYLEPCVDYLEIVSLFGY